MQSTVVVSCCHAIGHNLSLSIWVLGRYKRTHLICIMADSTVLV